MTTWSRIIWLFGWELLILSNNSCKTFDPYSFLMKWRYNVSILQHDITRPHGRRDMGPVKWKPLTLSNHPIKLGAYRFFGCGDKKFWICHIVLCDRTIKGDSYYFVGRISSSYQCPKFDAQRSCVCKWRYNAFLSRKIRWSHDQSCRWFAKCRCLNLSQYLAKFDAYRSCGNGDITLFFHMASRDHIMKEALVNGSPST